jgi:hypothetical protein
MLAYQDLLNISPYQELFKDRPDGGNSSGNRMDGLNPGVTDQRGPQMMMFFNALSQLARMFGGGGNGGQNA